MKKRLITLLILSLFIIMLAGCRTEYTVRFMDYEGNTISIQSIKEKDSAIPPMPVNKPGHTFIGWDTDFDVIEGYTVVRPIYEINHYQVHVKNSLGDLIELLTLPYQAQIPVIEPPKLEGYHFDSWVPYDPVVTQDQTVIAIYKPNMYEVQFMDYDTVIQTVEVTHGETILEFPVLEKQHYDFIGWDTSLHHITQSFTTQPIFEPIVYEIYVEDFLGNYTVLLYTIETEDFALELTSDEALFTGVKQHGDNLPLRHNIIPQGTTGNFTVETTWLMYDELCLMVDCTLKDVIHFIPQNNNQVIRIEHDQQGDLIAYYGTMRHYVDTLYVFDFSVNADEKMVFSLTNLDPMTIDDTTYEVIEEATSQRFIYKHSADEPLLYGYITLSLLEDNTVLMDFYDQLKELSQAYRIEDNPSREVLLTYPLDELNINGQDIHKAFVAFIYDHPNHYWIDLHNSYFTQQYYKVLIAEEYRTLESRQMIETKLNEFIRELELRLEHVTTDVERVFMIHDTIARRVDYAYLEDGITPFDSHDVHQMTGVILRTGAVCDGYSKMFKLLLNHFGIESLLVTGNSLDVRHMWNLVLIDNAYFMIDLTWNDVGNNHVVYDYFGLTEYHIENTHTVDTPTSLWHHYLYDLPEFEMTRIQPLKLFYNEQLIGDFFSIESAFKHMTDDNGDYHLQLMMNTLIYDVPTGKWPDANHISIEGYLVEHDGWIYSTSTMTCEMPSICDALEPDYSLTPCEDIVFNSNVTLSNLGLTHSTGINVQNHTLTLSGSLATIGSHYDFTYYTHPDQFILNIHGDEGATLNIEGDPYSHNFDILASINIDRMTVHSRVILRGYQNNIQTVDVYGGSINPYKDLSVKELNMMACFPYLLSVNPSNDLHITIDTLHSPVCEYSITFLVTIDDPSYLPVIRINESFERKIVYHFIHKRFSQFTDNGEKKFVEAVPIEAIHDRPIMVLPNTKITEENFQVIIEQGTAINHRLHITNEFIQGDDGAIYRDLTLDDDIRLIIEDGVLISVKTTKLHRSFTVLDSIHTIGANAFNNAAFEVIYVPNTVHTIESYAFNYLNETHTVYLSSAIETIESNAFHALLTPELTIYIDSIAQPLGWHENWLDDSSVDVIYRLTPLN